MTLTLPFVADVGLSDRDVAASGWLSPADPAVSGFETELAKTTGRQHAVVHAGARLLLLDVEPGTWTMDAGVVAEELGRRIDRSGCCKAVHRQHWRHHRCRPWGAGHRRRVGRACAFTSADSEIQPLHGSCQCRLEVDEVRHSELRPRRQG